MASQLIKEIEMANAGDRIKITIGMSLSHAANADYQETIDGPPRVEWEAMSKKDRDAYIDGCVEVMLENTVSTYGYVED